MKQKKTLKNCEKCNKNYYFFKFFLFVLLIISRHTSFSNKHLLFYWDFSFRIKHLSCEKLYTIYLEDDETI